MNEKEKAKELMVKFNYKTSQVNGVPKLEWECAKKCAIICVDEILKAGGDVFIFRDAYWNKVKQEIEKL